jgi:hypothetical protein
MDGRSCGLNGRFRRLGRFNVLFALFGGGFHHIDIDCLHVLPFADVLSLGITLAFAQLPLQEDCDIFINRAGVRLLFLNAELG